MPPPPKAERHPDPRQPVRPVARRDESAAELPNGGKPITQAREFWPHLLEALRHRDVRLMGTLNDARLREFNPDFIKISVPYQFHFEMIQRSLRLLEEVSSRLLQSKVRFEVVQDGSQEVPSQELEHQNLVKKASGLFGGRILDAANDPSSE